MVETQIKIPHTEYLKIAKKRKAGKTLESIAEPYGATRERIRQILKNHFPEITAKVAGQARKRVLEQKREKETRPCACGCGIMIPIWKKSKWSWQPYRRYVLGHQGRNRIPYKRTPESLAKSSMTKKRDWAAGKYDNRILRKTIIMRRKLWKVLREHPEGLTTAKIITTTGINHGTLLYWIKYQQYMKFDARRLEGIPGRPYIIKLAKEPPVNLENKKVC
jgi:hypothetical protein